MFSIQHKTMFVKLKVIWFDRLAEFIFAWVHWTDPITFILFSKRPTEEPSRTKESVIGLFRVQIFCFASLEFFQTPFVSPDEYIILYQIDSLFALRIPLFVTS